MDIRDRVAGKMLEPLEELPCDNESGMLQIREADVAEFSREFDWGSYQEEGEELLGSYRPMHSPGRITLHQDALMAFFWHVVGRMLRDGFSFWPDDIKKLVSLTVNKTYSHERFHLFCDIQSQLVPEFAQRKDREKEEALAVAFSRLSVERERAKWQSQVGRIAHTHYSRFLELVFDFRSPGYRDWKQFSSEQLFNDGLVDYVDPPHAKRLAADGVPIADFLSAQLDRVFACAVEEVVV